MVILIFNDLKELPSPCEEYSPIINQVSERILCYICVYFAILRCSTTPKTLSVFLFSTSEQRPSFDNKTNTEAKVNLKMHQFKVEPKDDYHQGEILEVSCFPLQAPPLGLFPSQPGSSGHIQIFHLSWKPNTSKVTESTSKMSEKPPSQTSYSILSIRTWILPLILPQTTKFWSRASSLLKQKHNGQTTH